MFKLVIGYWGATPGDGYKLISTSDISKHETAEEAQTALDAYAKRYPDDAYDLLIRKPKMSCNPGENYPTPYLDYRFNPNR